MQFLYFTLTLIKWMVMGWMVLAVEIAFISPIALIGTWFENHFKEH